MIPQILVSNNSAKQEEYINRIIKDKGIRTFNIYHIKPLKTEITIDQIRSIKHEIITKSGEIRLFICYSFDEANLEAQNAFLKTLEEKNEGNIFILCASNHERIIPTVKSRSNIVLLDPQKYSPDVRKESEEFFSRITASASFEFLSDPMVQSITREDAELLFDELLIYIRKNYLLNNRNAEKINIIIKKILVQKQLLQSNNLNPQLAADTVLIQYKKSLQ